ncbi:MAG TPA: hypothetical protein VEK06_05335, partial [Myxococcota bacterium]|nr:hypothetical protein [Myxococcota bacterium]
MSSNLSLLVAFLVLVACRPTPFQVKPVPAGEPYRVEKPEGEGAMVLSKEEMSKLKEAYKKAESPTLGLINGYYRLPNAKPFGAAVLVEGYGYGGYIQKIKVEGAEAPFAITPIEGDDALALNQALNTLLDMGVKFKELSMSDALALAEAEQMAVEKKGSWVVNNYLPP